MSVVIVVILITRVWQLDPSDMFSQMLSSKASTLDNIFNLIKLNQIKK